MISRVTASGLIFVLAAGQLHAGPLPAAWSYRNPLNEIAFPDGASGGLNFPNTVFQSLAGDGDIVATKLSSYSIAAPTNPDRVTSLPYQFAVELRDDLSGQTTVLNFGGVLSGSLWRAGGDLKNRFTGRTTQSAELGGLVYTVALTDFDGPDGYGEDEAGSITARVSVADLSPTDPDGPVATPEPATALLAAVGLAAAGAARAGRRFGRAATDRGAA